MLRLTLLLLLFLLAPRVEAQATQPTGGFSTWGPGEWILVISAVAGAVTSIVLAMQGKTVANEAAKTADKADTKATDAKAESAAASKLGEVNRQSITNHGNAIRDVLRDMPPTTKPTPEERR